jgi:RNA polymerase sigma-70 factor (sigma-E family)
MGRRAQKRADEEESFRTAFVDLFPIAQRVARRLLGNDMAAEDAAAEALARAFSRWSTVRDLPYRDAWVLRVVTNIAIDVVRRHPAVTFVPGNVDTEDATATRVALVAALRALPVRQREAVVLRYLNDCTEAQVAAALGISVGTVKTHLKRGLASMRGRLGDEFGRSSLAI